MILISELDFSYDKSSDPDLNPAVRGTVIAETGKDVLSFLCVASLRPSRSLRLTSLALFIASILLKTAALILYLTFNI
jgi:hypothetical protein